ncbi:MAG: hypothetical protein KUG82_20370 [Pseudomonadales bacterium]|nr:hypothetical protein [Pseudomonadales bacterium]
MKKRLAWPISLLLTSLLMALSLIGSTTTQAKSLKDLEFGVILYDYYQRDYFSALVEYETILATGNSLKDDDAAEVLQGGMLLSYGLAEDSEKIFSTLLTEANEEEVRNRAWYYLAQMYYQRVELGKASAALIKIKGKLDNDIRLQYHYLSMLINMNSQHLDVVQDYLDRSSGTTQLKPFLAFNLAINQAKAGDLDNAYDNLIHVANYSNRITVGKAELLALADRARHALALLAMESGDMHTAWSHLKTIRTKGLYSNRALLTYGWNAIEIKKYDSAIPALKILSERSISLPEVQEAKVLLAHIYELQGDKRGALKEYILAIKAYEKGLSSLKDTRISIAKTDVPEEFVSNLEAIMDDSDWYGTQPSVDYDNLTPFLLDLLSSHSFQESLRELGDLYAIRKNLLHWQEQKRQHNIILNNKALTWSSKTIQQKVSAKVQRYDQYYDQSLELKLHTQTLDLDDQKRFDSILNVTSSTLSSINEHLDILGEVKAPYLQPSKYRDDVKKVHLRANKALVKTNSYIAQLETVVRNVVSQELDQHEDRIKYYSAQARLARARLYDETLNTLEVTRGQ